jgi:alpha-tubulin suppressor-like RCC1 family protein
LGTGRVQGRGSYSSVPVQVPALTHVLAVAAGGEHTLALRRDGTVWAWGADELTDFVGDDDLVPAQVPALHDVAMVATGDNHAIALTGAGTVKTWGWNNFGQLGNGEEGTLYYLPQDD